MVTNSALLGLCDDPTRRFSRHHLITLRWHALDLIFGRKSN
jgi:hypothetical protein